MTETDVQPAAGRPPRQRRSDGERSRTAILREAAQLATVEGIGGLSISRLAQAVGMSKSGLFAHFGSKQELQLATMETASAVFSERVLEPALSAPSAIERLRRLAENYVLYVEAAIFPGGCFFASVASEMDTHPGPVRDVAIRFMTAWLELLEATIRDAQSEGALDEELDPAQLAFEIEADLLLSNALFVIAPESRPTDKARRALAHRLAAAAPDRS
jgi:AcrR family transcriptional regulator